MRTSPEWKILKDKEREIIESHQTSLPIEVGAIAKQFGIKILKSTMKGKISGERRETDGEVVIKVNRHDVKERQRFTIAHEIAHFLLHRDKISNGIVDDVLYRSSLSDELEREANRLAADIIMPAALIKSEFDALQGVVLEEKQKILADKAKVSIAAIKIRTGR